MKYEVNEEYGNIKIVNQYNILDREFYDIQNKEGQTMRALDEGTLNSMVRVNATFSIKEKEEGE